MFVQIPESKIFQKFRVISNLPLPFPRIFWIFRIFSIFSFISYLLPASPLQQNFQDFQEFRETSILLPSSQEYSGFSGYHSSPPRIFRFSSIFMDIKSPATPQDFHDFQDFFMDLESSPSPQSAPSPGFTGLLVFF